MFMSRPTYVHPFQNQKARLFALEQEEAARRVAAEAELALVCGERERLQNEAAALRGQLEAAAAEVAAPSASAKAKEEVEEMAAALAAARQRLLRAEEARVTEARGLRERVKEREGAVEGERAGRARAEGMCVRLVLFVWLGCCVALLSLLEACTGLPLRLVTTPTNTHNITEALAQAPMKEEVEALRARVRVLMRLEGGGAEEEDGEEEGCEAEEEGVAGGMESVERLLLRRVRRMETEAVVGRRRVAEAEEARRAAEGTCVCGGV